MIKNDSIDVVNNGEALIFFCVGKMRLCEKQERAKFVELSVLRGISTDMLNFGMQALRIICKSMEN